MAPQPQFPLYRTDFGFVLGYWRLQGTLQKMHRQRGVFIPRRVFLFKHVTSRSSAWAMPSPVYKFINSFILADIDKHLPFPVSLTTTPSGKNR
jgi:hypothetical protein